MIEKTKWKAFVPLVVFVLLFFCSNQKKIEQAENRYQAGVAYQKQMKPDSALIAFKDAVKLNPHHIDANKSYINIMRWEENREDEVLAEYRAKVEKHPTDEVYHYLLGTILTDPDEMMKEAKTALELNPEFYWGYTLLASAYLRNDEMDSALVAYKQAAKLDSSETVAWQGIGNTYSRLDSFDLSNQAYEMVLAIDSTALSVYGAIWRNKLQQEANSPESKAEVQKEIDDLLAEHGDDLTVLNTVTWGLRSLGELDKMKEIEEKILAMDSTGTFAPYIAYNRFWQIGKTEERIEYAEKFVQDYPGSNITGSMYSITFSIIQNDPKFGEEKAIEWGEKWIADCPEDATAYNAMAWNLYLNNKETYTKALEYAKKAVEHAKSYQKNYTMDTLGWAYFRNEMYEQALETMIEANKLYEEPSAEVLFHLGAAYGKNGQLNEALNYLALSITLEENEDAENFFEEFYIAKFGSAEGRNEFLKNTILSAASVDEPYAAPAFELPDMSDQKLSMTDFKDKVILIAFWQPT